MNEGYQIWCGRGDGQTTDDASIDGAIWPTYKHPHVLPPSYLKLSIPKRMMWVCCLLHYRSHALFVTPIKVNPLFPIYWKYEDIRETLCTYVSQPFQARKLTPWASGTSSEKLTTAVQLGREESENREHTSTSTPTDVLFPSITPRFPTPIHEGR